MPQNKVNYKRKYQVEVKKSQTAQQNFSFEQFEEQKPLKSNTAYTAVKN